MRKILAKGSWILIFLALLTGPASAQMNDLAAFGSGSKFAVQVNLQKFRETPIGGKLFDVAKQKAMEELKRGGGNDFGGLDDVKKLLGFDPFEEIQGITIAGRDYEHPDKDVSLIIQLKQTTGNLEGLVLGIPGYEASKHRNFTIHSAKIQEPGGIVDKKQGAGEIATGRVFGSVFSERGGSKKIVLSTNKQSLTSLLDSLDSGPAANSLTSPSDRAFVKATVTELPIDKMGVGPQTNIAKLLRKVELSVGAAGQNYELKLTAQTKDAEQAEQIRQMAEGLSALLAFMNGPSNNQKEFNDMLEILKALRVTVQGNEVGLSLTVPSDKVMSFLRDDAKIRL